MQIRKAELSDASKIQQLAEAIWWKHYPNIIGENQVRFMLSKMYNLDTLEKQIKDNSQHYFIIQKEDLSLGFISIEFDENSEAFINKFYILQTEQGKGIGTESFHLLLKLFPQINTIRLQVNRQNFKAINFYFKAGFIIQEVADFDIGDGFYMNDFIMRWQKIPNLLS